MLGYFKAFNLIGGAWLLWMIAGLGPAQVLAASADIAAIQWQVAVLEPAIWRDARLESVLASRTSTPQRRFQRRKPTQRRPSNRRISGQSDLHSSGEVNSTDWSFLDASSARQKRSSTQRPKRRSAKKRRPSGGAQSRRASGNHRKDAVLPEVFQFEPHSETP